MNNKNPKLKFLNWLRHRNKISLQEAFEAGQDSILNDLEKNFETDLEEGFSREGWQEYKQRIKTIRLPPADETPELSDGVLK